MSVAVFEPASDDEWLSALTDSEVRSALTLWAARLAAGEAMFLDLVGELDAREAWGGVGIKSAAHWLGWQCSLNLGTAREHVRAARALRELPLTRAAFAAATVSFSQVRALTRVATADNEASLLDIARHSTAAQLERITRGMRQATRAAETETARDAYEMRSFTYHYDDDGPLVFSGRLPAVEGAVLVTAIEAILDEMHRDAKRAPAVDGANDNDNDPDPDNNNDARDLSSNSGSLAVPTDGQSNACTRMSADRAHDHKSVPAGTLFVDPTPAHQDFLPGRAVNADALTRLAETFLASKQPTSSDPDTYRVVIRVDADTLLDDTTGDLATIDNGPTLAPDTVRRLLCDTAVRAVTELADGTLLDLGRTARYPNRALRRALRHRDHGCRWPGCVQVRRLQAHHLQPWSPSGETNLENLLSLCSHHHHLAHEGGYRITRAINGRLITRAPAGWEIPTTPHLPPARHHDLTTAITGTGTQTGTHTASGAVIDETTLPTLWGGEKLDLGHVIWTLLPQPGLGPDQHPWPPFGTSSA